MQIARTATSVSWIPSDSIPGLLKLPMEKGLMHYDPPPLTVTDLEVAIHPGRTAAGSQGPVVKSWVSASRASMPHLVAVDR